MKIPSPYVDLGFEVGTGFPVAIPLRHMVVTGQTQEAGKTTTLEALIDRAALPALAFVTKRGERSFESGTRIAPYFRERADWQFVASVLEATMREKLKFERAWIMRASKGAKTLADVHSNVKTLMEKAKGLSQDVYMTLDAYLEIVVPRVARFNWASVLHLDPGLNVLDLADRACFPPELQSLVMQACLEWVYEHCDGTVTIIPEAWEFLPQSRGSPVKLAAVELIRKGAGLHNYVWLDSQDIAGIDKEMLRSCTVWLLGVQREANEIKRMLENIPAGITKPKAADIAKLKKGQFYACYGDHTIKTYVQPVWMNPDDAQAIAVGKLSIEKAITRRRPTPPIPIPTPIEEPMSKSTDEKLDRLIELLSKTKVMEIDTAPVSSLPLTRTESFGAATDEEALYQRFKARLIKESPQLLRVLTTVPEILVETEREAIEVDGKSLRGRIAILIVNGFFDETKTGNTAFNELDRTGKSPGKPNVYRECDGLVEKGFLTKEAGGYLAVAAMKRNITK